MKREKQAPRIYVNKILVNTQNRMTRMMNFGNSVEPIERIRSFNTTTHLIRRLRGNLINVYKNYENERLLEKK